MMWCEVCLFVLQVLPMIPLDMRHDLESQLQHLKRSVAEC